MTVPYSFGTATSAIPLSQLDSNFNTPITLGNTAIQLGNTVTTLNNMTLANVTISSGNVTLTNVSVTTANVATANIATSIITSSETLSYGTANGVAYLNGSKVVTTGSALVFDGTNLGIGTSSPATKLVVSNAGANGYEFDPANGFISSYNRTTSAWTAVTFRAGSYTWNINNSNDALKLDSSGNLGLGVTPSAWSANSSLTVGLYGASLSTITGTDISFSAYYNGGWKYQNSTYAPVLYSQTAGQHQWFTAPSGTAGNAITFTQAMTLTAAGRLGLGLTSPSTLFEAYGGAAGTSSELTVGNASTAARFGVDTSNEVTVATGQAVPIKFLTSNTERARITSGGSFVVAGSGSDNFTTDVGIKLLSDGRMGCVVNDATTGTNSYHLYNTNATNNGYRFYVNVNGGINNYSANNVNLSDRREKMDFAPAGEYLSKICAIPVQTYKYIDQFDNEKTLGVVAQDVQAIAPELVTESNWGTEDEPKMRLSIYQTDLQYALMKCIQEQQALITQLTERITALEAK